MSTEVSRRIPLSNIVWSPVKLREAQTDSPEYASMLASIAKHGVFQPILVRPYRDENRNIVPDKFEGVEGCQRFNCSLQAKLPDIPAIVREMSDDDVFAIQIISNEHRIKDKNKDLVGHVTKFVARHPEMTQAQVAEWFCVTQDFISKVMSTQKLNGYFKNMFESNKIPLAKAYSITRLPEDYQDRWQNEIVEQLQTTQVDFNNFINSLRSEAMTELRGERKAQSAADVEVPRLRKIDEILAALSIERQEATRNPESEHVQRKEALEWVLCLDPASKAAQLAERSKKAQEKADAKAEKLRTEYLKQQAEAQRIRETMAR